MFRIKEIAMVATLGLILTVGALTTIYPQHASALHVNGGGANGGAGGFGNGVIGGQTPPGPSVACGTPAGNQNPNCGGTTPIGGSGILGAGGSGGSVGQRSG